MQRFFQYLNWTSFSLISFGTSQDIEYSASIKENLSILCTSIIIQNPVNSAYHERIIKRVIKSSGQKNFIIIGSGSLPNTFQKNIILKIANKPNFFFLFPSFAASQVIIKDSLLLNLHSTSSSISSSESIFLYLKFLIGKLLTLPRVEFLKLCPKNDCSDNFDVLKVVENGKSLVGRVEFGEISQIVEGFGREKIGFNQKSEILIFIANWTSEVGLPYVKNQYAFYYLGSLYHVNEVNLNEDIEGFAYKTISID